MAATAAHAAARPARPASSALTAAHAVTAATRTGAVTAVVLARAPVRCRIGAGDYPLATEIHGFIRHGRDRHATQQAKRKKNTRPHILLLDGISTEANARARPAPTAGAKSPVTKRKRMQRLWRPRDKAAIAA